MPWYFYNSSGELLTVSTATATDSDAIHDNVSGEIAAIAEKAAPVGADLLVIEDSAAANVKKKLKVQNVAQDLLQLNLQDSTELTIATGAITKIQAFHRVDGESDLDDNLDTINGGAAGDVLVLVPENIARNITIKHGTGNIVTPGGTDFLIPDNSVALLVFHGTQWRLIGGGGGVTDHGALTGLSDDDHTQYALLTGRSGGQELQGDTAASGNLTLDATSHATKGDIILQAADVTWLSTSRARMASQNRFRYLQTMAKSTKVSDQTLTTATLTVIAWNTEAFDTDGLHDLVTNNSRITVALTGKYLVVVSISYTGHATGTRLVRVSVNGTDQPDIAQLPLTGSTETATLSGATILSLTANDYVEAKAYQTSGGDLDVRAADSHLELVYIGE